MSIFRRHKPQPSRTQTSSLSEDVWEAKVVGKMKIDPRDFPTFDHRHLVEADFSGHTYLGFTSIGSKFQRCRFDNLRVEKTYAQFGSGREVSEYLDCSFDGARIAMGFSVARFVRCSFRNVDLHDWRCHETEIVDCVFSGRLQRSYFNGTVLDEETRSHLARTRNEFHGNDFSAMEFIDVDFRTGIDLTKQRLPAGPEYLYIANAAEALQRARVEVVHWRDLELRRKAIFELELLEKRVAQGQDQLFLRPADYYSALGKDVIDPLYALLRGG